VYLSEPGAVDDLVQVIDDFITSENQDRASFVPESKGVPTNLAALHATFSQPLASQARDSSSLENSCVLGGSVLYAAESVAGTSRARGLPFYSMMTSSPSEAAVTKSEKWSFAWSRLILWVDMAR